MQIKVGTPIIRPMSLTSLAQRSIARKRAFMAPKDFAIKRGLQTTKHYNRRRDVESSLRGERPRILPQLYRQRQTDNAEFFASLALHGSPVVPLDAARTCRRKPFDRPNYANEAHDPQHDLDRRSLYLNGECLELKRFLRNRRQLDQLRER